MQAQVEEKRKSVLIENIYSIIDSKLQYSEYTLKKNVATLQTKRSTNPHSPYVKSNWSKSLEELLQTVEKNSIEVQKLLFLRTKVNHVNADEVYKFIHEQDLVNYQIKALQQIFK